MKSIFYSLSMLAILFCFSFQKSQAQANTALSNLTSTSVNADLLPGVDNSLNLGSAAKGWKQLYINNAVFLGGSKFISYGSTLGLGVTAVGQNALAVNNSGFANTGIGFYSLASNTSGNANAAIGTRSLQANTTGGSNMAMGYFSLYSNTTGYSNVAIGVRAMNSNTTSSNEIAIGDSALFYEIGGNCNTAIGSKALFNTTNGYNNSAVGFQSMIKTTIGAFNTGFGAFSLYYNTTGSSNTALGEKSMFTNSTGTGNTAVGSGAIYSNDVGSANTSVGFQSLYKNNGDNNTMIGYLAGYSNTTGGDNTGVGTLALTANTSGYHNTATGIEALENNTVGYTNTADGAFALVFNTSGTQNTATGEEASEENGTGSANTSNGYLAMFANNTGGLNTAVGVNALTNSNGNDNSAVGVNSLVNNITGNENTALGSGALYNNTAGNGNTAIGYLSGPTSGGLSNASSIGYYAKATASNQIMLGNSSITSVMAAGSYTIYSDGRFKKNIQANVPGLEFINQLRPVTYNYNIHGLNDYLGAQEMQQKIDALTKQTTKDYQPNHSMANQMAETAISEKEKKLYTGFVAQEVEKVAVSLNYEFSGLYKPQNDRDVYGLSYSDFVVPLVKAVQELSDSLKDEKDKNATQDAKIDSLEARLQRIEQLMQGGISNTSATLSEGSSLAQNAPNPFQGKTSINYTLPSRFTHAEILISDMNGKLIQTINVSGSGRGVLSVDAGVLSFGVYSYALYADSKMIGAKQMVVVR